MSFVTLEARSSTIPDNKDSSMALILEPCVRLMSRPCQYRTNIMTIRELIADEVAAYTGVRLKL